MKKTAVFVSPVLFLALACSAGSSDGGTSSSTGTGGNGADTSGTGAGGSMMGTGGGIGPAAGGTAAAGGIGPATGGIGPATGGIGPATGGIGPATGGTTSQPITLPFEECATATDDKVANLGPLRLQTNQWSSKGLGPTYCIFGNADETFGWKWDRGSTGLGPAPDYPEVFVGQDPWGEGTSTTPDFPIKLSEVTSASMTIDIEVTLTKGEGWNLAFEAWTTKGLPGTGEVESEVMAFFGHNPGYWPDPPEADAMGHTVHDGNDNYILHDWASDWGGDTDDPWRYTQFRREGAAQDSFRFTGTLNVKPFLDYLINERGESPDNYLTRLEIGNETYDNSAGTTTIHSIEFELNGKMYKPTF